MLPLSAEQCEVNFTACVSASSYTQGQVVGTMWYFGAENKTGRGASYRLAAPGYPTMVLLSKVQCQDRRIRKIPFRLWVICYHFIQRFWSCQLHRGAKCFDFCSLVNIIYRILCSNICHVENKANLWQIIYSSRYIRFLAGKIFKLKLRNLLIKIYWQN